MLKLHSLSKVYQTDEVETAALDMVNIEIGAGEFVAIMGPSGCGKSTLLNIIGMLDTPTSGQYIFLDEDVSNYSESQLSNIRKMNIGFIFQSFNLMPTLNVLENACLPGLLAGKNPSAIKTKANELLSWLGLDQRFTHLPAQLSGGEMQRTAIARALINDPAIILADEPTGNLDSRNGQIVIELLAELNRKFKRTVVIATHSNLADSLATVTFDLKDGRILDQKR